MNSKTVKGAKQDVEAARRTLRTTIQNARAKMVEAQEYTEDYIKRNPKRATAIAVGVGAVLAAAITSYWMSHRNA